MLELQTEGVLFDGDGTLYGTEDYITTTFVESFKAAGCPVPPIENIVAEMGRSLKSCLQTLAPQADINRLEQIFLGLDTKYIYLARPNLYVLDVLEELQSRGLKLGLVTSRFGVTLRRLIDMMGIGKYLQAVVAGNDVAKLKPYPDPIHKGVQALGVSPERTVMVGDTWVDIASAKAAGLGKTIGYIGGFHKGDFREYPPDHLIGDLREILVLV